MAFLFRLENEDGTPADTGTPLCRIGIPATRFRSVPSPPKNVCTNQVFSHAWAIIDIRPTTP